MGQSDNSERGVSACLSNLIKMQENPTITAERTHATSKLPNYIHVYSGHFKDLNPTIRTVIFKLFVVCINEMN